MSLFDSICNVVTVADEVVIREVKLGYFVRKFAL